MACCGRNKGPSGTQGNAASDLEKFAYLTPRQLRIREEQRRSKEEKKEEK